MDIMNVYYVLAVQRLAQVIGGTEINTWVQRFFYRLIDG